MLLASVLTQFGDAVPAPVETPEIVWSALLPLIVLAAGAVLLLTAASIVPFMRRTGALTTATVLIGLATIASCVFVWQRVQDPEQGPISAVSGAVAIDGYSLLVIGAIAAAVVVSALLFDGYMRRSGLEGPELFVLMLLSAAGGAIMASANDLIVMFIGLETLSIATYVMASMERRRLSSQEAGFKYFLLGAFASAFFLYGIALIYGATGSTNLVAIADFLAANVLMRDGLLLAGMALLLVGFGFKLAAAPFHAWTPDVYQGSPTVVTGYMAAAVKIGAFAALLRVFQLALGAYTVDWQPVIYALALLSMIVGSTLGLVQTNVKRMLGYSWVNHAGIILVGVQVATSKGAEAVLFYLVVYALMIAGAFGVISLLTGEGDAHAELDDLRGLSKRKPGLALVFTVFLLSQAGVPGTAGFFAKFYVIGAAVEARSFWLALAAMLASVVAAFYYLRVIVAMYLSVEEGEEVTGPRIRIPGATAVALGIAVVATLALGLLPSLLLDLVQDADIVLAAF
jgi:NADH-quinone oxidoreductase subunit N